MRKLITYCSIFCAAVFALSSCDPIDNPSNDPGNNPGNDPGENPGDETKIPEVVITTSEGQIVAGAADESVTFSYEIVNPVDGGVVTLEIPETNDWISNPKVDWSANTVTVSLAANIEPESRSETLTVRYTYGEESVIGIANIIQTEAVYDYVVNCTYGKSVYYGYISGDPSLSCYYFRVSNTDFNAETTQPKSYTYNIDFYYRGETEDKLPEPGTYKLVPADTETTFTFTDWGTSANYVGEDLIDYTDYMTFDFVDGTIILNKEGNTYSMTAVLTDWDGKVHYVTYNGEPEFEDVSILSTLDGDLEMELKYYDIVASDYDDFYGTGMRNWRLEMYSGPNYGELVLYLDILTPYDVYEFTEDMLFDSFYSDPTITNTFYLPGQANEKMSWLITWGGYGADSIDPRAAIMTGTIELNVKDDGKFKMTTDVYDQFGNSIKLTMDNMNIWYYDQSMMYASAAKKASIFKTGVDFAGLAARIRK